MPTKKRAAAAATSTDRSLVEWFQILGEIVTLYDTDYKAAQADGKVTLTEWLALGTKVFDILTKHSVTLPELQGFVKSSGPLLNLLGLH